MEWLGQPSTMPHQKLCWAKLNVGGDIESLCILQIIVTNISINSVKYSLVHVTCTNLEVLSL